MCNNKHTRAQIKCKPCSHSVVVGVRLVLRFLNSLLFDSIILPFRSSDATYYYFSFFPLLVSVYLFYTVLGCSHNNTRFANGSFVPTAEPCLNCKCINANLICALRVCPDQAFPPPRGCVIVQKKNSCCPYMTCSKLHTVYKDQEKKVVTHDRKWYEQNIRNRIFSQNALQRRIEDTDEEQQLSNGKSMFSIQFTDTKIETNNFFVSI